MTTGMKSGRDNKYCFVAFFLISHLSLSLALTNPDDVAAINSLYLALESPPLPGWIASGGDPCGQGWQGVLCNASQVETIVLIDANLVGELGVGLNIDFSNNHIGGSIPSSLPVSLHNFFLSGNEFTGTIPESLSSLKSLSVLSLNNNLLSGKIPDVFQDLGGMINLDLSSNNLSGPLPPSMQNLSTLTTLNVENNLFNGPIPDKLLGVPNFRKSNNLFNVTVAPSPSPATSSPATSPKRPFLGPPSNGGGQTHVRSPPFDHPASSPTKRIVWVSILGAFSFVVLAFACLLCGRKCLGKGKNGEQLSKPHLTGEFGRAGDASVLPPSNTFNKDKEAKPKVSERGGGALKLQGGPERSVGSERRASMHEIDMSCGNEMNVLRASPIKRVIPMALEPARASLQKPSTITSSCGDEKEGKFVELVSNIEKIRHANVVQLVGFCSEHGQRLLIYEYCRNGTLHDLLHSDGRLKIKLSWNLRVRMALEAAKALEYLHETCDPPSIHRNFKSANILVDEDMRVHVSDCGLAPLFSSGVVSQLSGQLLAACGYGAPEFEYGMYTLKCDVYSYGVMVDPSLKGDYPAKSLSHFADVISRCVQSEPEFRPLMSEVVQDLSDMIQREDRRNGEKKIVKTTSLT
ncbi:unnamed protein product [Thlaspi arvense]|uniref:Protein kinase domain-containing protein n=1 Tax=Thlaspi arvense TaxID=13288 RepID=A0AAU9RYU8_THLAR|nr:unnamed protein product [Thlaspi arvense]